MGLETGVERSGTLTVGGQSVGTTLAGINKCLKAMDLEIRGYYGDKYVDDQGDEQTTKMIARRRARGLSRLALAPRASPVPRSLRRL